jgi:hypothetical protein
MTLRTRKFLGSIFVVVFVIAYAAGVVTLGDHVPDLWWAKLVFYVLAGVSWGVPILPLLRWMNRAED